MHLEDYIKLRFYLNNLEYKELPTNVHIPDTTVIEKNILTEDKQNIKYTIKYYLKGYACEEDKEPGDFYRFGVNVSAVLYVENPDKDINSKIYTPSDSVNINYYMASFKEPKFIENYFETIWNTLNIFDNYPFRGYY